jgi:hypothetical protein
MLARSFRVDAPRLIPQGRRGKPLLFLVALILAGCGGSPQEKSQPLSGNGFRFEAPAGWHVVTSSARVSASRDSELAQVSSFPLVKTYSDALFDKVTTELAARMQVLAKQVGGSITGSGSVTVDGIRSHRYDVTVGGHVDQYTFVLQDKREYQLLCRRNASSSDGFCARLLKSFKLA